MNEYNKDYERFFYLNEDKSLEKIQKLVGKYIVFNKKIKKNSYETIPGLLLDVKDNSLLIKQYDDGSKETKEMWTDINGNDLFEDFKEIISLDNILAIEEYKKNNIDFKDDYINKVCKITNKNDVSIIVTIREFDGFNLWFEYKYLNDENGFIEENTYPLYFIKNIEIL